MRLQTITELNKNNPLELRDYCYQDEAVTTWIRDKETFKERTIEIKYHCESCQTERYYFNSQKCLKEIRR